MGVDPGVGGWDFELADQNFVNKQADGLFVKCLNIFEAEEWHTGSPLKTFGAEEVMIVYGAVVGSGPAHLWITSQTEQGGQRWG